MCTTAASQIVQIIRDYSQHFTVANAPYMLSYATYISATIHARVVAQMGRNSSSYPSLLFCRGILEEHQQLYASAGKARTNLEKLITHLGIDVSTDDEFRQISYPSGHGIEQQASMSENMPIVGMSSPPPHGVTQSPQLNWELSDIDLEAIAQSFRLESELHYLMHPSGVSGSR